MNHDPRQERWSALNQERIPDPINYPKHYNQLYDIEAKDIIQEVLSSYEGKLTNWEAHCLATYLKYRLRAGDKTDALEDLSKSNVYRSWFNDSRSGETL